MLLAAAAPVVPRGASAIDEAQRFVNRHFGRYIRPILALAFGRRPHPALTSRMHYSRYTSDATWRVFFAAVSVKGACTAPPRLHFLLNTASQREQSPVARAIAIRVAVD